MSQTIHEYSRFVKGLELFNHPATSSSETTPLNSLNTNYQMFTKKLIEPSKESLPSPFVKKAVILPSKASLNQLAFKKALTSSSTLSKKPTVVSQKTNPLQKAIDKSVQVSTKTLNPSPVEDSDEKLRLAFAKKYHVSIPSNTPFKQGLSTYTELFREMFAGVKMESQEYGFRLNNRKRNLFELQWELIRDKAPKQLQKKLFEILAENPKFDAAKLSVKALLDAGAKVTTEAMQQAISCDDHRFTELLFSYGFQPSKESLPQPWEDNPKFPTDIAAKTMNNVKSFEVLVSYGYKPTLSDLHSLCKKKDPETALPFFEVFKSSGFVFPPQEYLSILSAYFSSPKFAKIDNSSASDLLPITNKLIKTITPYSQLNSNLFQSMVYHARLFMTFGYQPIIPDLQKAIKNNVLSIKEAVTASKTTSLSEKDREWVFAYEIGKRGRGISQAIFRAIIDERFIGLEEVIEDQHNYRIRIRNRASGMYSVTSDDLMYAVQKKVDEKVFDLLVHCWANIPTKSLFRAVLTDHPDPKFFEILLDAGYEVDSSDFQYACEKKCSPKTLFLLLNFGMILHSHDGINDMFYTRDVFRGMIFHSTKAGYIPSQEDVKFAQSQGYEENVLKEIESFIGRAKVINIYTDHWNTKHYHYQ